jgi:uncharacterized protein (TIGR02391 family)
MLLQDYNIEYVLERYVRFSSELTWFRMYCAGKMGKDKSDYIKGFESIKSDFEDLYEFHDKKRIRGWKEKLGSKLISDLELIIKVKRLTDSHISKMSTIIWDFQNGSENDFRTGFLDEEIKHLSKSEYPDELYIAVNRLVDTGANEEAVLQAFKFLDSHIQKLLSIPPHKIYGEELVNHVFSPSSGVLQLETHQNEQIGLRNFFSGANALFRNPAAHRFMDYDDFDTGAIIAMVAMMANLASKLAKIKLKDNTDTSTSKE